MKYNLKNMVIIFLKDLMIETSDCMILSTEDVVLLSLPVSEKDEPLTINGIS